MFTEMSCSDSFHLVHVLWAVKIPCLFWHSVEDFLDTLSTVTHGPVCSPLWVIVGTVFSTPLYIALWMAREDSGGGVGSMGAAETTGNLFTTPGLDSHFWGLSTSYQGGEKYSPFPWRNSSGHQTVSPIQCVALQPLFLSERVLSFSLAIISTLPQSKENEGLIAGTSFWLGRLLWEVSRFLFIPLHGLGMKEEQQVPAMQHFCQHHMPTSFLDYQLLI